jgi:hypothetical protein
LLSTEFPRTRRSSRLAGAAGALLLQGGFVLLFLSSMPNVRPPRDLGRELTVILRPMPKPVPPSAAPTRAGLKSATPLIQSIPQLVAPAARTAPPAAIPDIQNFGQALNGCALERYNSLTPDRRARCPRPGEGVAIQEEPNLMGAPSHVKDEAYWQAEWAREKSPIWLPCTGGFIDFICLAQKIANGSLADPRTWPIYETKQLAPGDFYKIEQAYDAWNKEHPVKAAQR